MLAASIEDKLIKSFDEKVSDTISEWKTDARKSKITLRQLLSLTSGIDTGENGRPPLYAAALGFPVKYEPGAMFEYGPAPFQIFGEVMRRKLLPKNETALDYLKRRVFSPIGLIVASWTHQNGQPNIPSGAFLTAREWARFGQFLENGGRWNGKQIVSKKLLDECFKGTKNESELRHHVLAQSIFERRSESRGKNEQQKTSGARCARHRTGNNAHQPKRRRERTSERFIDGGGRRQTKTLHNSIARFGNRSARQTITL
jgi:CubicO group peptidase (beta-lactamase class C family)